MKMFNFKRFKVEEPDIISVPESSQTRQISVKDTLRSQRGSGDEQSCYKIQLKKLNQKIGVEEEQENDSIQTHSTINEFNIYTNFNSKIIQGYLELKNLMELKIGLFNLRLIFRASQENFDVNKFHQLCNNYQHTVVLAQVLNGNIVGGYSPLSWEDNYEKCGTHYKSDKTQQAFIFNYTSKQKYRLVKTTNNKAIVGCKYLGPTFGGGYDFSIGNFANNKYSSSCNFPMSYSKQIAQLKSFKLTKKSLIGISDHEELFLIKQWQVFQVCFDKSATNYEDQNLLYHKKNFYNSTTNDIYKKQQKKKNLWHRFLSMFKRKSGISNGIQPNL